MSMIRRTPLDCAALMWHITSVRYPQPKNANEEGSNDGIDHATIVARSFLDYSEAWKERVEEFKAARRNGLIGDSPPKKVRK